MSPNKSIQQIIGENLRRLRHLNELTQDQVAAVANIERSTYANYEAGTREMPVSVLETIASLFGCESYLLEEDGVNAQSQMLTASFRIADMSHDDLRQVARFKDIALSYLKMNRILQAHES